MCRCTSGDACVMYPCVCVSLFSRHGSGACMRKSFCVQVCMLCAFVYEASPGQCSVPESSRTAYVKTISTHTALAAHMTTPSPCPLCRVGFRAFRPGT